MKSQAKLVFASVKRQSGYYVHRQGSPHDTVVTFPLNFPVGRLFDSEGLMSNPLRCVVSRQIIQHVLEYGHKSIILHEILECGHPYTSIPVMESEFTAKRRRCAACACRKPVQSAKIA